MKNLFSALLVFLLFSFPSCDPAEKGKTDPESNYEFPFQDPTIDVDTRVDDLVSRMTIEEKSEKLSDLKLLSGLVKFLEKRSKVIEVRFLNVKKNKIQKREIEMEWLIVNIKDMQKSFSIKGKRFNLTKAGQKEKIQSLLTYLKSVY